MATKIGQYAFRACSALALANFPAATEIYQYAFYGAGLESAIFPVATSISTYAFNSCTKLTLADFPAATSVKERAFSSCSKLASVNFPVVTEIGRFAFSECARLALVLFPKATNISTRAFSGNYSLVSADFPAATNIGDYAFTYCSKLNSLILRATTQVCALSDTNAFSNTAIASGTGYIYVPAALIDSYKTATNWTTYANQFRALESYTVDGTTTGELDPTKVNA